MLSVFCFVVGGFMVVTGLGTESMGTTLLGMLFWNMSGIFLILKQQDIISRQVTALGVLYKLNKLEDALSGDKK